MADAQALAQAVHALQPAHREVLLGRVRDGLPLSQLAERLDVDPTDAGRLLLAATARLAPLYGASARDYRWLHACREDLRALPHANGDGPGAAPPEARRRWLVSAGMAAIALGLALLGWSLWGARAPVGEAVPGSRIADPEPDSEALPGETDEAPPLAAADLPLLAVSGDDHALLEGFELLAWIAEQHLPPDAAAPPPPPLPASALLHAPAPEWQQLSAEQAALLSSWERHWQRLGDEQRRQLAANAQLWAALTPEQQGQLRARLEQWRALGPAERARLRLRHESFSRLGTVAQVRLRAALAHLQGLAPEARRVLKAQFDALPPAQREAYLLEREERAIAALAQQVFAYVPSGERAATLAMLAEFGEAERALLQRLAARMAPWQRRDLREALLAQAPRQRAAYLRSLPTP